MSKEKIRQRIVDAVGQLEPGERIEVVTVTQVGSPKQDMTDTLVLSALGMALGGMMAFTRGHRFGVILTDRRVLLIDADQGSGRFIPGIAHAFRRGDLRAAGRPRGRLMKGFDVITPDGAPVVRMNFPLPAHADGEAIAVALGA